MQKFKQLTTKQIIYFLHILVFKSSTYQIYQGERNSEANLILFRFVSPQKLKAIFEVNLDQFPVPALPSEFKGELYFLESEFGGSRIGTGSEPIDFGGDIPEFLAEDFVVLKVSFLANDRAVLCDEAAGAGLQDGGVFAAARSTKRKGLEA